MILCDFTTVSCWPKCLCQPADSDIKLVSSNKEWPDGKVSTKYGRNCISDNKDQDKQWHTVGKGADVGFTFTPLLVSSQKSHSNLLQSDFITDTEEEGGK